MICKHKYKIHEIYFAQIVNSTLLVDEKAIVVCEKCGQVKRVSVEV